ELSGLLEVSHRVGALKLLDEIPTLQEFPPRFGGCRRHRNLASALRRRRGGIVRRAGGLLLCAAAERQAGGNCRYQEKTDERVLAHPVLLSVQSRGPINGGEYGCAGARLRGEAARFRTACQESPKVSRDPNAWVLLPIGNRQSAIGDREEVSRPGE